MGDNDSILNRAGRWQALYPCCVHCGTRIEGDSLGWYSTADDGEQCDISPSGFHEVARP